MADTNRRTVASITREGRGPQTHAYDEPDLSPIEFLRCVMHATHLPMASRIQAASALLPYTNSFPSKVQGYVPYRCKIIIGGLGPCDPDPDPRSPDDPTRNHSQNPDFAHKTLTRDGKAVALQNIETTSYPPYLGNIIQTLAVEA